MQSDPTYGLCKCGCGEKTPIAYRNWKKLGWVKGEPIHYVHGHHRRMSGVPYVEEDRGYATPCWIWQRSISNGYGMVWDNAVKKMRGAHVIAWEEENGPVPEGLELDHLCRQRACINTKHLEPVTRAVNTRRGRSCILTDDQVNLIRQRWSDSESKYGLQSALAREFGISVSSIHLIVHGKNHRS